MHGIILAGGLGTRMGIYTKRIGNKHLMPVYDRIMIEMPIMTLVNSGIRDITIVTGNKYSGQFVDLLGDGKEWGIENLNYAYQFGEGGIADALRCARNSVPLGDNMAVILGDNLFTDSFKEDVEKFEADSKDVCGHAYTSRIMSKIFLKQVRDPERFGVACISDGKVTNIIEKPKSFVGDLAVVGLYMYTYDVFEKISRLSPSDRKELEVTDLNMMYLREGNLQYSVVRGDWSDMGTPDSLLDCALKVREKGGK